MRVALHLGEPPPRDAALGGLGDAAEHLVAPRGAQQLRIRVDEARGVRAGLLVAPPRMEAVGELSRLRAHGHEAGRGHRRAQLGGQPLLRRRHLLVAPREAERRAHVERPRLAPLPRLGLGLGTRVKGWG